MFFRATKVVLLTILFFSVCRTTSQTLAKDSARFLFRKANETYWLDSAITFANGALRISDRESNVKNRAYALYLLGKIYNARSDYSEAQKYLDSGFEIVTDKDLKGLFLLEKGKSLQLKKQQAEALVFYLEAFKIFENTGHQENLVRTAIYFAEYYRNLKKYGDAAHYISFAFSKNRNSTISKPLQILLYNRAAAIKSESGHADSSLYYSGLALAISKETGNLHQEAVSLNEIAFMQESKGNLNTAIDNYKKAEDTWLKAGYKRYWINALENRARCYGKTGAYQKSNELLLQLIDTARKNDWLANLASAYKTLHINYKALNNDNRSNHYKALSSEAELELYKKENLKELEEIKTKYETEKKENLLKEQQKEIEIANIKYSEQKKESRWLLYGIVLLVSVLVLIVLIAWQRSRLNRQLQKKNRQIEDVNGQLEIALQRTELLMKEIHHRVKNNLQIISSMFHLQSDASHNEEIKNLLMESDNRIMLMAFLHEKLYSGENTMGLHMKEYIEEIANNVFLSFKHEDSDIHFRSRIEDVSIEMDKAVVIGIVINELITNSIKHAFEAGTKYGEIVVEFFVEGTRTILKIKDNGKGIPDNFSFERSSSFGLNLVNIMVKHSKGKIYAANNNGTEITIEL